MKLSPATITRLAAALALGAASLAGAQQAPTTTASKTATPGKAVMTSTTKASALIVGIDATSRVVTLKTASGKVVEVVCGPEVKNFDQLHVGGKVAVEYVEALSLELKKGGAGVRGASGESAAVQAAAGEKPGAAAGHQITVMADVVAVDSKTHMVTLRGPRGLVDLKVEDPEQLKNIKKGDQVEAVYTEAVAVTFEAK